MARADDWLFDARRLIFVVRQLLLFWLSGVKGRRNGAVRLRVLFETLGMTYLKFGQFLALRFDLLSPEVRGELEKLFEGVQPIPFPEVRRAIEHELKAPLEQLFATFSREPIASASIAQVHEARTASDERVAVKVQRPGVDQVFASDMRWLGRLATLIDWSGISGTIAVGEAVDEFARWTSTELDFLSEGATAERLRAQATPDEVIPRIHWTLTTRRILTMEFIDGASLVEVTKLVDRGRPEALQERLPGVSIEEALHRLAVASMHQIFVTGFFHGDPHPGNMLILPTGRVAFVDFGIFGQLTPQRQGLLHAYMENLILGDIQESFRSYSRLFLYTPESDYQGFQQETEALMRQWYSVATNPAAAPQDKLAGRFVDRMSLVARRNHVRMKMDILLFWRVFIVLDSVSHRLSSRFDLMREAALFFRTTSPALSKVLRGPTIDDAGVGWDGEEAIRTFGNLSDDSELSVWIQGSERERHERNRDFKLVAAALFLLSVLAALRALQS
jgi:ubiquinone biosynthesis protein